MGKFTAAPATRGSGGLVVAASNAPDNIKENAFLVCDGVNDEVQIQAALDATTKIAFGSGGGIGAGVVLSAGEFRIDGTINLENGMRLCGQGINVTAMTMQVDADVDMFTFNEIGGLGGFVAVSNLLLYGNNVYQASGSCFNFKTPCKDFHIKNVFINAFKDDGIVMRGSWGAIYDNLIVEFCKGTGIKLLDKNAHVCTGDTVSGGNLVQGVVVTQGSATGRMFKTANSGASTIEIVWDSGTAFTTDTAITDGTASYTPLGVVIDTSFGPKMSNCKIMDNEEDQIYIEYVVHGMISDSEFRAWTGYSSIVLNGSSRYTITNNRFQSLETGTIAYIDLRYNSENTYPCRMNFITNNSFEMKKAAIPAININDHTSIYANLIKDNFIMFTVSGAIFVQDLKTGFLDRNLVIGNEAIAGYALDSVPYTFVGNDINVRPLLDSNESVYAYAIGNTFSTRNFTGTRVITLPKAFRGYWLRFNLEVAQGIQITPNDATDTIRLNDFDGTYTEAGGGKYVTANTVGAYIVLECLNDTDWYAVEQGGVWTAEE